MKIKEGFELRSVCGENIIVATGMRNIDFSKVISLNESAALLWKSITDKEFTNDDLVKTLLDNYEVDEETARKDVQTIVDSWTEIGLLE